MGNRQWARAIGNMKLRMISKMYFNKLSRYYLSLGIRINSVESRSDGE